MDKARADLTHFRVLRKSVLRAYFHLSSHEHFFFLSTTESTASHHSGASLPSRVFHFVLIVRSFVTIHSSFSLLSHLILSPFPLPAFLRSSLCSHTTLSSLSSCPFVLSGHLIPRHLPSHTVTPFGAVRSLANNAAAVPVPMRCFR